MTTKGVVARVADDSIAAEIGLVAGDKIINVNGNPLRDIIDLSFALAEEYVEIVVEKAGGEQELYEIEKDYDEDLGIEFESAVFDKVRQCANRCVFCFVDQMPPGMRESLYIKDDDYRLSFLYGNFITLTNLAAKDLERINRLHLSPLYVSVHTTDKALRSELLSNAKAANIIEQLTSLTESDVELHTQVVLCPHLNDGKHLEKTIADLYKLRPQVLSLAIVPVGLTKYRENCPSLDTFSPEQAAEVISMVTAWQERSRRETGSSFVYLSDEFYLASGLPIPEYTFYDGFPQLENGIGLVRNFLTEWKNQNLRQGGYDKPCYLDVVCGVSAAKILRPLLEEQLAIPNLTIRLVPVENRFFGPRVTVTGLLTGNDIIDALKALVGPRDGVIIPGIALRKGEHVFLDGITVDTVAQSLATPVKCAYFAADLGEILTSWEASYD
ncbi:MAG: putative radical enzyme [Firmicutes bacterium]|nr:putative radical enzyme [Bacillota bacterium]